MNGKRIEIRGVAHDPDTLKVPEYKEGLESAIKHASLIVLESAPTTDKKYPIETIQKLMRVMHANISDQEIESVMHEMIDNNPHAKFFEQLQDVAAKYHKNIAIVDPIEDIHKALVLQHDEATIEQSKRTALLASLVTMLGAGMTRQILSFIDSVRKDKKETVVSGEHPRISRRSFLKFAAVAGVGLFAGINALSIGASANQQSVRGKNREENPLGTMLYTLDDYREVAIAEALEKLSEQDLDAGPIEVIYGGLHVAGIRHYIEHPIERKMKLQAYKAFSGDLKDAVKVFSFTENGGWEKVAMEKMAKNAM